MTTKRKAWAILWAAGGLALLATPAAGQQRPSLDALEQRLEAAEAALCAAASLPTSQSYRPVFCEPSCVGCGVQAVSGFLNSCVEESPGVVVASGDYGSCSEDIGTCDLLGCESPASSRQSCVGDPGSCPAGEVCKIASGQCLPSAQACADFPGLECPAGETCIASEAECYKPCTYSFECGLGTFSCVGQGPSQGDPCVTEDDCTFDQFELVRLTGLDPVDPLDPVGCQTPSDNVPINANDADACLGLVETALGQACTP